MINYRSATINDLPIISIAEDKCFNELDRFSKENLQRMISNPRKSIIVDIILFYDEIIGYAIYLTRINSKKVRLYSICILPKFSGRGFAREYLKKRIINFSKSFYEMTLEVRETNFAALKLYNSIGFTMHTKLPNYYSDGEDGYRLIKKLN